MRYKFQIPAMDRFQVEYYFSNKLDTQSARVFPPHLHDKIELYILLDGDVSFMVESALYKLSSGDAIVTKPNEMHNCILNSLSVHRHLCFWFDCNDEFLFKSFLNHDFGKQNLLCPSAENKARLLGVYERLQKASEENDTLQRYYLVLEILDIFSRCVPNCESYQTMPSLLCDILTDVDKNLSQIKDLQFFTNKYFISQSTLNRLFKEHLHTTPKLYLDTKRFAFARQLLRKGCNGLQACMQSGFADYSNFIRLFKKRFGVTPKEYRNS